MRRRRNHRIFCFDVQLVSSRPSMAARPTGSEREGLTGCPHLPCCARNMKPKFRTLLPALVVVAALAGFALLLFTAGKSAPLPPLPNPNGYDDLVRAGEMLEPIVPFMVIKDMNEAELRAALATTAFAKLGEALALARLGLHRECRVPLDYSLTSATHDGDLSALKGVARAFTAQGSLAEMESRTIDASESYLDLIRLGQESARGGVVLDSMHGRTLEAMGLGYLGKLVPKLAAQSCRKLASELESIDERSESPETVLRQEKAWARRTYGFRGWISRLLNYRSLKQEEQKWASRMKGQQNQRRSLMLKLAARAYEQETGQRPKALTDLVPSYLKTVPRDVLLSTNILLSP